MTEQAHSAMRGNGETRYATCQHFLKIFDEDMQGLYQLSFLLTGDHQKGEKCFVAGMEACAKENRVFREWARTWAKRVIVQNAIRELQPRPSHSGSFALAATAFSQKNGPIGHFDMDAVLELADFERCVFVLCVLERYREHECALLLGCSASEVREARTQAIQELAAFRPSVFDVRGDRSAASGQQRSRPKGSRHEGTCSRSIVRSPVQA
jgi:DNA-directed RNA polymerase specialized sigma24 family protein